MSDFFSLRRGIARFFVAAALFLAVLPVSAIPLPPGASLFTDPQLQACFDELASANGWTMTEDVTSLRCPDRSIAALDGLELFTNLLELDVSGNRIVSAHPIDLLPQLELLDLSDNRLADALPLLSLQNLKHLHLSGNGRLQAFNVQSVIQGNPGLTHIGVAGIAMGDLSWLPFPGPYGEHDLQELDVSNTGVFPDLAPVVPYINLRVLRAAGNQIVSAAYMDLLPQLEVLDLGDNQLVDVIPLQALQNLTQLRLSGNGGLQALEVQSVIQGNPGLTHIGVAGIAMGDLSWLPFPGPYGEHDLQELDVSDTGAIPDLAPVVPYINLRVLRAAGNQLASAAPLDLLPQLEVLDLSGNRLNDIEPLKTLGNLRELDLSGNEPADPLATGVDLVSVNQVIAMNPGLVRVGVGGVPIGQLQQLAVFDPTNGISDNLLELDVSDTGIADLVFVGGLPRLQVLNASGNQLVDAQPLVELQQLKVIDLRSNDIRVVLPLVDVVSLALLDLRGNNNIQCADLDALEAQLLPGTLLRPLDCIVLTPPDVVITSPASGDTYYTTSTIAFAGNAADLEDGVLDAQIQWTSNLLGSIGAGPSFSLALPAGDHVITAMVTDSHGNTSSVSVAITVLPNTAPELVLLSPANGSVFMLQEFIKLTATADDLEDGDISAGIQWSSSLDGFLGTGRGLKTTLSLGEHTLTAVVTDSSGGTQSATTRVVVEQIQLDVAVSGNGRNKFATLTWSGARTLVDIYKDGMHVGTGEANGTAVYRFKDQAVFKVCETGTVYCSVDVIAQ